MKTKLMATGIFFITIIAVMASASQKINQPEANGRTTPVASVKISQKPKIELVFALDTTSSMSGMINAAKEKIWSIASTMASAKPSPEISIGIVAYRDRGDAYITKKIKLSEDLDSVYAQLLNLNAAGGGDSPESVNAALYTAVHSMNWSQNPASYKVIFLVGDAPGHNDYQDDVPFTTTLIDAKQKGIVVNTIQAGQNPATAKAWQRIAFLGTGDTFSVKQQGSAIAISTPFDKAISDASQAYDDSRVYFGNSKAKKNQKKKLEATRKLYTHSTKESLARRAKFNISSSGAKNYEGNGELITAINEKKITLDAIKTEDLPEKMQTMNKLEKNRYLEEQKEIRKQAKKEIASLSKKRDAFIKKKLSDKSKLKDSLDVKLYGTLKSQAEKKGINLKDAGISY